MPHVMLKKNWNGNFRRTIHRATSAERVLTFTPGEVVEIEPNDVDQIANDLGKALIPVEWDDEKKKFVPVDLGEIDLDGSAIPQLADGEESDEESDGEKSESEE